MTDAESLVKRYVEWLNMSDKKRYVLMRCPSQFSSMPDSIMIVAFSRDPVRAEYEMRDKDRPGELKFQSYYNRDDPWRDPFESILDDILDTEHIHYNRPEPIASSVEEFRLKLDVLCPEEYNLDR